MEEKVIEFYRRCVFGAEYDRNNKTIENITKWCFNNAWRDMARTLKPKPEEKLLSGNQNKTARKIEIEKLKTSIKNKYFTINLINKLKANCYNASEYIFEVYKNNQTFKIEFTFGQAQKVVNMFFKYLYTFKDEPEINLNENDFDGCDCPVDSIILDKVYETETFKGTVWSQINEKQYKQIQKDIQSKVEREKYNNKLDFEFDWQ